MENTYTIKLQQFEGPFDLLLFFIERDELDIYDIPIAKITNEFLDYMQQMEALNIDLASEFILVAATLCRIKAKMLLPRKEIDEEGNEIDPREELIRRLLEYKRFKSVLDDMKALEDASAKREKRGNTTKELKLIATRAFVDAELESLTLFKLMKTFERVMQRFEDKTKRQKIHTILKYSYTVDKQKEYIFSKIKKDGKTTFDVIFVKMENRLHAIVTFLAVLELANTQMVKFTQGEGVNNFWISLS